MGEAILYQLHSLLAATALCFCRLAPTFYLLPFFASGNIPTVVRHPIIIVVSCALVQHYHYELPRFYVSTSKSIIKALINMHSFEIQLSPIG